MNTMTNPTDWLPPAARPAPDARQAAVLLLLYPDDTGAPRVPFLRRRDDLKRHSGQIALPGGARDPDDVTLEATARREAWEELRIDPLAYEVVGTLDPVYTQVSNFHVFPYVGVTGRRPEFVGDAFEVAALIEVPLEVILDPANWHEELWELPDGRRRVYYCDYEGHQIWGLTARILNTFVGSEVLEDARAAFARRVRHRGPSR